jgi:1,2-phenylacetyl-CoA epoxidase PaaB subunit
MSRFALLALTTIALIGTATFAADKPTSIAAYPQTIRLENRLDRHTIVVQATYPDGTTMDVTAKSKLTLADPAAAKLTGVTLTPLKKGKTTLAIEFGGHKTKINVEVSDPTKDRLISFRLDVIPVITKSGCNSGACHGSSRGKDGFNMSLFGYDPAGDHHRMTRQMAGRRINLAQPTRSLMIEKALGRVQHTGGDVFNDKSEHYRTLVRWLEAGAPNDAKDVAKVVGIKVAPLEMILNGPGTNQQLTVSAQYSDGTDRDITNLAVYSTSNERSAKIGKGGRITAGKRGEAFVTARFGAFTVGSSAIVLPKDAKFTWPNPPESNYIDKLIHDKLRKLRIKPSALSTDEVFVRRLYIDLIGSLPTPEQTHAFVADKNPKKREKLVDVLLKRPEFVDIWVMKFSELLQIRSDNNANRGISYKATVLYHDWLKKKLTANEPMDKIVAELLSSTGGTFSNPPANFYQIERGTKKLAENVAQVFMGTRIQCAQCHNHPFDRWTMDDYYGFVSLFSQIGRKKAEDPREQIVYNKGSGEIKHPIGGRTMKPKFLGGEAPDLKGKDRRLALSQWLVSDKNPYFSRNLANIVWSHFFGRGIVEPVDDVRITNPPSNKQLLDTLGKKFASYKYDFRRLVRDICTSKSYQLETKPNETNVMDESNFSRGYVRRVRSEVLYDMLSQATNTMDQNKFRGLPKGARAVQIADGKTTNGFLNIFGRAERKTVCSCEVSTEPNLSQALHLINGYTIQSKISSGGIVTELEKKHKKDYGAMVDALYMRTLSRKPTKTERSRILEAIGNAKNKRYAMEDLFWALINSRQFIFNH